MPGSRGMLPPCGTRGSSSFRPVDFHKNDFVNSLMENLKPAGVMKHAFPHTADGRQLRRALDHKERGRLAASLFSCLPACFTEKARGGRRIGAGAIILCLCLCIGMLLDDPRPLLVADAPFAGRAIAAEPGGAAEREAFGKDRPDANSQKSEPGSGKEAQPNKPTASELLDSRELTRALSRLLQPEQALPRPPAQGRPRTSFPPLEPDTPADGATRKGPTASSAPDAKAVSSPMSSVNVAPASTPEKKRDAFPVQENDPAVSIKQSKLPASAATPPVSPVAPVLASPATPAVPSPAMPKTPKTPPQAAEASPQKEEAAKKNVPPASEKPEFSAPTKTSRETPVTPQRSGDPARTDEPEVKFSGRDAQFKGPSSGPLEKVKQSDIKHGEDAREDVTDGLARRNIVRVEIFPVNLTVLSAPYDGVISSIIARDGDRVDKDRPVAKLDTRAEEQALAAAQALASDAFERLGALPPGQSRERDEVAAEYLRQSAQVRSYETRVAQGGILAPFAGTVTDVRVKVGEHVKQGSPIVEIAEADNLEIVCTVPSAWLRWLKPGHIVWVYVDETAKSYEAVLVRLGGKVDPASKTLKAYARFSAPQADLLPGMSGSASIRPQLAEERNESAHTPETGPKQPGGQGSVSRHQGS